MLPDELLVIFLSKTQMQKIKIIYKLHFGILQISDLELHLNESRKKIKRIVESLNLDIEEFNSLNGEVLGVSITKDKVSFTENLADETYVKIKDYLQEKYLLSSGLYKSLLFILEKRNFSILQLSQYISYSESYTYKLVNRVKDFFFVSNLGLTLSKRNETILILEGEETTIRLLHCLLLIIVSVNNGWYIDTIKEKEIEYIHSFVNSSKIQMLSPSNLKRINIIIGVYESALKRGCKLSSCSTDVREIGRIINKEIEIPRYFNYIYKQKVGEVAYLRDELIHLAFIINYLTPELRSMQEKINIGKELYNNKSNHIIKMCISLVNMIQKKYAMSKNDSYLLVYSLCNRLIVLHYFKLYKFAVPNELALKGKKQLFIKECICKSFKEYRKEPSYQEIIFNFHQIIVAYINFDSPIKIYIEFQNKPEYKTTIKNILTSIYNPNILKVIEDYKLADIIISDSFSPKTNQKYFYFHDVFDQVAWKRLGAYLNKEIKNKKEE
ncbi:hypothetical protein ACPTKN_14395 [Enterococcus faecalis]|uniref:hypothetical protein n=1 Tax=Enterococcus faecalis TaxID=1351 RepID=UPI003CC5712C